MSIRDKYQVTNIREFLYDNNPKIGEERLVQILSDFLCLKNPDVERFLVKNSIEFVKKNQSVTYLVFSVDDFKLLGYFTIALKPLEFDYYYGKESQQFSFIRVPDVLFEDEYFRGISSDAKLLYGSMLDRLKLSMKNGWLDDKNRVYIIYTIDNIRKKLGCSKEKAIKVLSELDTDKGIGLIEKKRRGLGKPDMIYVKNFIVQKDKKECSNTDISTEVGKSDFKRSEKRTSRGRNFRP